MIKDENIELDTDHTQNTYECLLDECRLLYFFKPEILQRIL